MQGENAGLRSGAGPLPVMQGLSGRRWGMAWGATPTPTPMLGAGSLSPLGSWVTYPATHTHEEVSIPSYPRPQAIVLRGNRRRQLHQESNSPEKDTLDNPEQKNGRGPSGEGKRRGASGKRVGMCLAVPQLTHP